MSPGPRPISVPSGIQVIHPTVWPQDTNVTDRQDRIDRQDIDPIAQGERFYKRSQKNCALKIADLSMPARNMTLRSSSDLPATRSNISGRKYSIEAVDRGR